jgi:predicted P-loop ATPase/GTPase
MTVDDVVGLDVRHGGERVVPHVGEEGGHVDKVVLEVRGHDGPGVLEGVANVAVVTVEKLTAEAIAVVMPGDVGGR